MAWLFLVFRFWRIITNREELYSIAIVQYRQGAFPREIYEDRKANLNIKNFALKSLNRAQLIKKLWEMRKFLPLISVD